MSGTRNPNPLLSLRGRAGGHSTRATHDPREYTAAGRRAFIEGFERQVDPDGSLPPGERRARAEAARKAHFTLLALHSAVARAKKSRAKHPSLRKREERPDPARVAELERRIALLEGRAGAAPAPGAAGEAS